MPTIVADVLYYALLVYWLLLMFRLVMDWVFLFRRSYRATGPLAVVLEVAYTLTDPPLRAIRSVLPPLRLGSVSLDLGFIVLVIVVRILMGIVANQRV